MDDIAALAAPELNVIGLVIGKELGHPGVDSTGAEGGSIRSFEGRRQDWANRMESSVVEGLADKGPRQDGESLQSQRARMKGKRLHTSVSS